MQKSMLKQKVAQFPQNPGVYFFRDEKEKILYIGKATNLRSRVSSYFRGDVVAGRSEWIGSMVSQVTDIDFQETDSVLEALILESNLIKKNQPKYNTLEKDDKSFSYFVITKEEFPRVVIIRYTDLLKISNFKFQIKNEFKIINDKLQIKNFKYRGVLIDKYFGPYTSKHQMQVAIKIIRRIFPFHALKQKTEKGCLDFQIGLCPGPYAGSISKADYKKNIRGVKMILEGKKQRLVLALEKEMLCFAKKNEFEKAAGIRNKIFALKHIRDVALIRRDFDNFEFRISNFKSNKNNKISKIKTLEINSKLLRVEAYDISNISGTNSVGSMVVFSTRSGSSFGGENWQPNKSQYRKFKIKTIVGSDDVASMREVLLRRMKNDWPMPDLILLDGGQGHANMMSELVIELGLDVLVVAVAKGKTRKNLNLQFPTSNKIALTQFPIKIKEFLNDKNLIKNIMDEAHRFAITFHRKLRRKNALK